MTEYITYIMLIILYLITGKSEIIIAAGIFAIAYNLGRISDAIKFGKKE